MRMPVKIAILFALVLLPGWLMASAENLKFTGTFSSLKFDQDEGDLLGAELKVVVAPRGYQGVFQMAEGEPSQLMLVDVVYVGNRIRFVIPETFVTYGGGVFVGTVESGGISGTLSFPNGASSKYFLARKSSYWD